MPELFPVIYFEKSFDSFVLFVFFILPFSFYLVPACLEVVPITVPASSYGGTYTIYSEISAVWKLGIFVFHFEMEKLPSSVFISTSISISICNALRHFTDITIIICSVARLTASPTNK